jgi:septal ring-binding cell division protein DamX
MYTLKINIYALQSLKTITQWLFRPWGRDMNITTKTIRGITISSLITFGLTACSSSPAPWTQADDSPWGAKREAETQNLPSDEAITDTSLSDPVLLADPEPEPEPIIEPEPIMMSEPDPVPAPEVIAPVVIQEELTPEQEVMALAGTGYAVQVYAGKTSESVEKFSSSKDLAGLTAVKTDRAGSIVYVLVDLHEDRASANAAAANLEVITGSKPWVRSVAGLQKIVAQ